MKGGEEVGEGSKHVCLSNQVTKGVCLRLMNQEKMFTFIIKL